MHAKDCDCRDCFKAKLASIQTRAGSPGNRRGGRTRRIDETNCSWEAGIAGEHRRGGTFMPYLGSELHPIPIKEFGEKRHTLEAERKRLAQPSTS